MSTVPVRTYRPIGTLVVTGVAAASLLAVTGVMVVALPARTRASFSVAEDVTLVLGLGLLLAVLYGIGRTRLRTDADGLHVVNGFRTHDLAWAQAVDVSLRRGAPWAVLDTSAGETVQLMAIQSSDGARAGRAVRELRSAIRTLGGTAAADPLS
ncbi:MAG: PH domain-containing protein [Actinomycetota bacterium]|nr:PH domain-containing protein [Actinomycetota bacterium]